MFLIPSHDWHTRLAGTITNIIRKRGATVPCTGPPFNEVFRAACHRNMSNTSTLENNRLASSVAIEKEYAASPTLPAPQLGAQAASNVMRVN